jgi:hypothetical protein
MESLIFASELLVGQTALNRKPASANWLTEWRFVPSVTLPGTNSPARIEVEKPPVVG